MLNEHFDETGKYFTRNGSAKDRGLRNRCMLKLFFFSADRELLTKILYETSEAADCFEVRLSKEDRAGVFHGSCDFTNESSLGDYWARYVKHPNVWAVIQNEEFSNDYRDRIRKY